MTYKEALLAGRDLLKKHEISDAKTDAWLLLAMACKIDRNFYYMHMQEELPKEQWEAYVKAVDKRAAHMPLQYITGEQEFMGFPFLVDERVLIPRQDTEILVEEALKRIKPGMEVLDLCTGSGCIIISILKNMPKIRAAASDVSGAALCLAKENAKLNQVSAEFTESDLFEKISGKFDMIVSNPPYIPTKEIETLMPEVRDHEPKEALDGSEDGLLFYRKIISEGKKYLKPKGFLLLEIGCGQGEAVSSLLAEEGYIQIEIRKDLAGLDRVIGGINV